MVSVRQPVSVVVPFRGTNRDTERLLVGLALLEAGPEDQVIVADNSDQGVPQALLGDLGTLVRAEAERSSYHARNAGAAHARGEWILFMDADCIPSPGLIEAYFAEPIAERVGVVAGEIVGDPDQRSLLARYTRSRRFFNQTSGLHAGELTAATANLLVRRSAFEDVGGFVEGIRSAGDIDLCLRLARAGWRLERRPDAVVHHRHREEFASLMRAIARYGAGARWLNERYPGSSGRWPLGKGLLGSGRDVVRNLARGRLEEAGYRALDGVGLVAHNVGYMASNTLRRGERTTPGARVRGSG